MDTEAKVSIDVGYKVILSVSVNDKSGYLYDHYQSYGSNIPVDLITLLKGDMFNTSITNYVYFLLHSNDSNIDNVIFNTDTMLGNLEIYHITEDNNYFTYLIGQLHAFWTLLSPVLYNPKLNINVKWDIYLHCPHHFLPASFIDNHLLFKQWLSNNENKIIILNGNEEFKFKQNSYDQITTNYSNCTIGNRVEVNINKSKTGVTTNSESYSDEVRGHYKIHGQFSVTDDDIVVTSHNHINGKTYGPTVETEKSNKVRSTGYVIDGVKNGLVTHYYPTGNVKFEIMYKNGKQHGQMKVWRDRNHDHDHDHILNHTIEYCEGRVLSITFYSLNSNEYYTNTYGPTGDIETETYFSTVTHIPIKQFIYNNKITRTLYFDEQGEVITET